MKILESSWFIVILVVFALVLRMPYIGGSLWMDEAAQALESTRPFSQQLNIAYDFQPPLYHYFVHFITYLGTDEAILRSTSVVAGLVTIIATFQIGKLLKDEKLGALAAILLSINSFHIFFSQELRPYSFAAMWGVLSWWILLYWLTGKRENRKTGELVNRGTDKQLNLKLGHLEMRNYPSLVAFALCSLAGLYSVYLYPFLLFSQIVYVWFRYKQHFLQFSLAIGVAVIGFLPWLPFFWEQLHVASALRQATAGWDQVVSFPQIKALPLTVGKFIYGVVNLDANLYIVSTLIAVLSALTALSIYLWKKHSSQFWELLIFYGIAFGVPLLTAWIISFIVPVVQPKRVLFLLPLMLLGFSQLILISLQAKNEQVKRIAQGLLAILFLMNIFSTYQYYKNPLYQRENWRGAIETIDTNFSPQHTIVVFGFDEPFAPWQWYPHQDFPTITTGTGTVSDVSQISTEMETALGYDTVVVFDYLRDLTDPNRTIETWLEDYNYSQQELFDYPNLGFIRVFRRDKQYANREHL